MARKKNATFQGATPFEVDVDALTLRSTIENVVGDTALVYDMLTGENGETNTIRHIGGGRGCPLGQPLWQQHIGKSLNYTGVGSVKGGNPGVVWLIAHPFFVPEGETKLRVRLIADGPFFAMSPTVRVTSTTGTDLGTPRPLVSIETEEDVARGDSDIYECEVDGLTTGLWLIFVEANTEGNSTSNVELLSWHGYFPRMRRGRSDASQAQTGTVVGVTTPAAGEAVAHVDFDAALFAAEQPIDGYLTTYLNRNLNGLEEFGSGWPAGGNASYTHVDRDSVGAPDDTDPDRSRFHACTRAGALLANEPELDYPWVAEGIGAYSCDATPVIDPSASAPTAGMLSWFAPFPLTAASIVMHRLPARAPDFQTGSSRLKFAVLAAGDALANWRASVNTGGGAVTGAFGAAFAVGPAVGVSNCLAVATGAALAFTGDAIATVEVSTDKTTAFAATYTEFFLLGYCLYWEP